MYYIILWYLSFKKYRRLTNPSTDPPGQPARSDPRTVRPDAVTGRRRVAAPRTRDRRVGWRVWSWKIEKTNPTVLSPKKVVVFRRWERFASGFSSINLEMAWYLWDPVRSCWDLARSRQDPTRSHRVRLDLFKIRRDLIKIRLDFSICGLFGGF